MKKYKNKKIPIPDKELIEKLSKFVKLPVDNIQTSDLVKELKILQKQFQILRDYDTNGVEIMNFSYENKIKLRTHEQSKRNINLSNNSPKFKKDKKTKNILLLVPDYEKK